MAAMAEAKIGLFAEYFSAHLDAIFRRTPPAVDEPTRAAIRRDIHALAARRAKSRIGEIALSPEDAGCFGTKLFPKEISLVLAGYGSLEAFFEQPSIRYVYLRRRDVVRQAISQYVATESGVWFKYAGDRSEATEVPYDREAIAEALREIEWGESYLDAFFSERGEAPLLLWYEDVIANLDEALDRIAAHAGVARAPTTRGSGLFARQANAVNEALHARFMEETRTQPAPR